MTGDGSQDGGYANAGDCISAGMYCFSQSDLSAAEAWWRRALELDPGNERAKACLRLLENTSSTGFVQDSWARNPSGGRSSDIFSDPGTTAGQAGAFDGPQDGSEAIDDDFPMELTTGPLPELPSVDLDPGDLASSSGLLGSSDLYAEETGARPRSPSGGARLEGRADAPPGPRRSPSAASLATDAGAVRSGATGLGAFVRAADLDAPTDDVTARGPSRASSAPVAARAPVPASPWDEGPSRTAVVTIQGDDFDAVADQTPLPELDRDQFFNRGDPSSKAEIVDFLRATGDLPEAEAEAALLGEASSPEARSPYSDDLGPIDVIPDGVSTEPIQEARAARQDAVQLARARYKHHDFQGLLEALDGYEADDARQSEVRNMVAESRANLLRMYEAKIGSLDQVPRVRVSSEEIIWLNLNHRAGFILSQVDGTVTYEDLVSLSGMPRLDTVRILTELLDQNVIES